MEFYISPNYTYKKIENPQFDDLVDVFQDRMENWVLNPSEVLLRERHSQVTAVGILISYFEGIEIYISGKDSKNESEVFFINGFRQVFKTDNPGIEKAASALYTRARCGFAHDGLFRYGVYFSDAREEPILVTYPRSKDGRINLHAPAESIIINPHRFYEAIRRHFHEYLSDLRNPGNKSLRDAFRQAVQLKWGFEKETPAVGMSEEEFLGGT